jgi:hypothetical protein
MPRSTIALQRSPSFPPQQQQQQSHKQWCVLQLLLSIPRDTASMSSSNASQSPPPAEKMDPVLRNALRYTISPREYQLLHQYLLSRAPAVKKRTINPRRYDAIAKGPDDYTVASVRASLRLGVTTFTALKTWELIKARLLARGSVQR